MKEILKKSFGYVWQYEVGLTIGRTISAHCFDVMRFGYGITKLN